MLDRRDGAADGETRLRRRATRGACLAPTAEVQVLAAPLRDRDELLRVEVLHAVGVGAHRVEPFRSPGDHEPERVEALELSEEDLAEGHEVRSVTREALEM